METLNDLDRPSSQHPRNPWVAGGLSLVLPGLGQVYNGQWQKGGMAAIGLSVFIPILTGITRLGTTYNGMLVFMAIVIAIKIWVVVDAVMVARRKQDYVLSGYEGWPALMVAGGLILLLSFVIDPKTLTKTESFEIPSPSSLPTVQIEDNVLADNWAYRKSDPDYGHLIVFKDELQQTLLYRVVGLPGDSISYVNNVLMINGEVQQQTTIGESQFEGVPTVEYEEVLPNGFSHRGYLFAERPDYSDDRMDAEEMRVPDGEYYVLGDFRDNAQDSRFLGTIRREQIQGRLLYSWWGASTDRMGVDFTK